MTSVALYARLSVTTEESVSIARQLEAGRAYAAARGWEVVLEAVDDGVSASRVKPEDRLGWRRVLDAHERYDVVVLWKADRLARRVLDFLHAAETLQERGAGLVAVEDQIDLTIAHGRGMATMLAVFGEMEAAAISTRVRDARRALVRAGRRAGGAVPFGWQSIPNPEGPGSVLAQDPDRIGIVRGLAQQALAGASLYALVRWLHEQGIASPRAGGRWANAAVEDLLRNPILAGITRYTPGRSTGDKGPTDVLRDAEGLPRRRRVCCDPFDSRAPAPVLGPRRQEGTGIASREGLPEPARPSGPVRVV